jgi:Flp pilus assembly protein TadD
MSRRRKSSASRRPQVPRPVEEGASSGQPVPLLRRWIWGLGTLVPILAFGWWGYQFFRVTPADRVISSLSQVASLVSADRPERKEAVELADELLRDYPESAEALYSRGVLLARYGFADEAAKTWKACLLLVPDLAAAYEQLGILAFRRGDNEQAIELLSKAVEFDAHSAAAGLYLGKSLNQVGRMEEAIPVLERFLTVAPQSPEPYFQLGQACLYLHEYEQARKWYEAALRTEPGFAQAYYGLATTYGRLREDEAAREYREKYAVLIEQTRSTEQRRVRQNLDQLDVEKSLAETYVMVGKVHMSQGQPEDAQACWSRAKSIDPSVELPVFPGMVQ